MVRNDGMNVDGMNDDAESAHRRSAAIAPLVDIRFLLALNTLIVNDQILKAVYGNWLTGKLSDVAGLIVMPVVVGVLLDLMGVRR